MRNYQEVLGELTEIVEAVMGLGTGTVGPDNYLRDFGADSLHMLEMLFEAEDRFDLSIPSDRAESFINQPLRAFGRYLHRRQPRG